jgi:plastocyanin
MNSRSAKQALVALSLVAACGSSNDSTSPAVQPPSPPPTTATVQATPALAFTPGTVTIAVGGTVAVAFGSVAHNLYFDNGPTGAPANIPGTNANLTKALTFPTPGTFVYNCHIHPGMHGTVIVVDPND